MSIEIVSVLVYAILMFGTVALQASYVALTSGLAFGFSNREGTPSGIGPVGQRIDRTVANLKEGAILYLPLAVLAITLDIANPWTAGAALATILSRVLYVPIYIIGVPVLRTLIWAPSFLAVAAMMIGILLGTGAI